MFHINILDEDYKDLFLCSKRDIKDGVGTVQGVTAVFSDSYNLHLLLEENGALKKKKTNLEGVIKNMSKQPSNSIWENHEL